MDRIHYTCLSHQTRQFKRLCDLVVRKDSIDEAVLSHLRLRHPGYDIVNVARAEDRVFAEEHPMRCSQQVTIPTNWTFEMYYVKLPL